MSGPTSPALVEAVDREAAADSSWETGAPINAWVQAVRNGEHDEHPLVQRFARHRVAAIAAARPMVEAGWQPIETAPVDCRFLIWCKESAERDGDGTKFGSAWRSTSGELVARAEGMSGDWTFTHWQPLPAPPSKLGGRG